MSKAPFRLHRPCERIDVLNHSECLIESISISFTTSATVIEELNVHFAQFELPDITVTTNNSTHFVSTVFTAFLKRNGINQITSAPYHLASNLMAEYAVQYMYSEGNHLRQHLHPAG